MGGTGTGRGRVKRTRLLRHAAALVAAALAATLAPAAQPAQAADPVIAAAGDIACDPADANFNGGLGTTSACRQMHTSDLLVGAGLTRVLALGDLQYDSASYNDFLASYDPSWGRVRSITRPVLGNHEGSGSGYFDYFNGAGNSTGSAGTRGKGYYSFDVGAWHLIALNSNCDRVSCAAGSEQEQWLRSDLAAHADGCKLAYWHHPRFSSGHDGDNLSVQPLWQALYEAQVDVALVGHSHHYERLAPMDQSGNLDRTTGIRQFVVGTGGAFFTGVGGARPNSEVRQNHTYGVLFLTLGPSSYRWEFVPEGGKTFTDSGSGSCHRPAASPPSASFTVSPSAPVTGQSVTFSSTSTSDPGTSIAKHEWDLDGNGSFETDTGSTSTASRAYTSHGTVTAALRVTDGVGNTDVTTRTFTVKAPPRASLSASPNPALTGQAVTFDASGSSDPDGSITSYEWDLDGDGSFELSTNTVPNASRTYASVATIETRLRVTDNEGYSSVTTRVVTINNRPPVASFTATPNPVLAGQTVTFDAAASSDPDGTVVRYQWDLDGNGTLETDTGTNRVVTRSYPAGNSPTIRLRVTDNLGQSAETTRVVTVGGQVPTARFVISANPVLTGDAVTFDASTSIDLDGTITRYEWDLDGNGTLETDAGANPTVSRAYATGGSVKVKLRVTDNSGTTAEATATLTVQDRPPVASFTASPNPVVIGQKVNFDASASRDPDGRIVKFEWDLNGNGTYETDTNTVPTASRTYSSGGTVQPKLRVTDNVGNTHTQTLSLAVLGNPPSASFTVSPSPALSGQAVTFTSTSTDPDGSIVKHEWDLDGNGEFDPGRTGSKVTASYPTHGTVVARLHVTDDQGMVGEATRSLTVQAPPVASFTASPNPPLMGETVSFDGSSSTDPDGGSITKYEWDLNGNGTFESTGVRPSTSYSSAGTRNVKLRVTDQHGHRGETTVALRINSRRVDASFTYTPQAPWTDEVVAFRSTSSATGADNEIVGHRWDLDGDGTYETDTGKDGAASSAYASTRALKVGLEVKDKFGNIGFASLDLVIASRPLPPPLEQFPSTPTIAVGDPIGLVPSAATTAGPAPGPARGAALLEPFPIVRIAAAVRRRGTLVRRLTVKAPPGSSITVRCRGGRCPARLLTRRAARSRPRGRGDAGLVRFRRFERRLLTAGVKIEVLVTEPGLIGKYVRFTIRSGKSPVRKDSCLSLDGRTPVPCPGS
jgi:YD repeat-containing protein